MPLRLSATAIYFYDLRIMSKIAKLLIKPEDVELYEIYAGKLKEPFNRKYFNIDNKQIN